MLSMMSAEDPSHPYLQVGGGGVIGELEDAVRALHIEGEACCRCVIIFKYQSSEC